MRTRVKICCISSVAEAALAVRLGADALGLVARMPSGPGPIPDDLIAAIIRTVPPPVATFLLTSEEDAGAIASHVHRTGASTVQVVQHISPEQSARLRQLLPDTKIVQVIHVDGHDTLDLISIYEPHTDAFLLDSGRPSATTPEFGGTGRVHDWSISAAFVKASPKPVFLAGGLNPANVSEAILRVAPYGLDLCSGIRSDGALDRGKAAAFVHAARQTDLARLQRWIGPNAG